MGKTLSQGLTMTSVDPEGDTLTAISAHNLTLIVIACLKINVLKYNVMVLLVNDMFSFQGSL